MSMTLYHVHWCPECEVVRRKLAELDLPYNDIVVPDFRPQRKEVFAVSGQYYVPVLQDGDIVLSETDAILAHLDSKADSRRLANG
ncbi:MAG TPA: glutathione S-transferase N-terminal domain-containing protein [Nitrospira sp.]|jgi:mycoredoxin|nr:glutathione S-transferase N-terminal domain-containing protein [Nitrospiraceae bacterium]HSF70593.1 glutathione S-transferase N-terminal domain-containing protein [Nitrospira sp.]